MRLYKLELENFRRIQSATIYLSPSTFFVGPNNTAKSSIVAAVSALLSLEKERLTQQDILEHPDGTRAAGTSITAYFGEIPSEVVSSRGFRGRVINGQYVYRKSLTTDSTKPKIETQEYPYSLKPAFQNAKRIGDLLTGGIPEEIVAETLGSTDPDHKLAKDWYKSVPDAVDFNTAATPTWVSNPGGIPQNVLSRLPRLIHIPALTEAKEIDSDDKKYALGECLSLLFEDLVGSTTVANEIQEKLDALEEMMDPKNETSLVSGLLTEINEIIAAVFPSCGIAIDPSLQNLIDVLRPKYNISVFSNIATGASRQGTGLIRTCAFAMLHYHARLKIRKELQTRPILVAFEEPELFLHPSAGNMLRDTIYSLGESDQIIATTHSPWMIDLSRDLQSVTRTTIGTSGFVEATNYGVSTALANLVADDKGRVRMLQLFDDELSRIFFSERVVVVEGDSEVLTIKNTLRLLPDEMRKAIMSRYQVVNARGKAAIISLVRYLRALGIDPIVMHDSDSGVEGAEKFNAPIMEAVGDPARVVVLDKCLEDALGYPPPNSDKPYRAFSSSMAWKSYDAIPAQWKEAFLRVFSDVVEA